MGCREFSSVGGGLHSLCAFSLLVRIKFSLNDKVKIQNCCYHGTIFMSSECLKYLGQLVTSLHQFLLTAKTESLRQRDFQV